ncbi:NUDIX domain-containing protein [Actinokineospora enzanensis]|uniref:NUDIX domain-containing protein n=1 Tax=Actinokineospora enzanensis TaxID=155975 RepID=UPI000380BCAD|nr:NUDIX hydrolase [Actinokineospora enzanensis]
MNTSKIVTADAVLFGHAEGRWRVLLIQRGKSPYRGRWALPGGKLNPGESPRKAVARELREETGVIMPRRVVEVGVYDKWGRDPRGDYVSHAYAALMDTLPMPRAADDARAARWVELDTLARSTLAFDHDRILTDAVLLLNLT